MTLPSFKRIVSAIAAAPRQSTRMRATSGVNILLFIILLRGETLHGILTGCRARSTFSKDAPALASGEEECGALAMDAPNGCAGCFFAMLQAGLDVTLAGVLSE